MFKYLLLLSFILLLFLLLLFKDDVTIIEYYFLLSFCLITNIYIYVCVLFVFLVMSNGLMASFVCC